MSEGTIHLADQDSASDLDAAARRSAPADPDRLATVRNPPPAPSPGRKPHVPALAVPPPPGSSPQAPAGFTSDGALRYATEPPPALPRTSWWRALITSTLAPPLPLDERTLNRRLGLACVLASPLLVGLALVIGLRGDPSTSSPTLSFAIIIARALLALGMLAFSHSLLKMGERLFTPSSRT